MAIIIVRLVMLGASTAAGMAFGPALGIPATNWWLAGAGFLFGVLAVLLEWQARRIPVDRLFWGAMGGIVGLGLGLGLGTAVGAVAPDAGPLGRGLFGLLLTYLGASVALAKRDELEDMSTKLFPKTAARRQGFKILDTSVIIDGRIVDLSGVSVLNVNELANALRPVVLPGELVHVHVVKEGKEAGQGVAYLDDGTMVVVDHGKRFIGQQVSVPVTSVLQTTAGRMIFSRLKDEEGSR